MLNKVFLIGRLTRDPELRFMPNGEAVCNFGLATSEKWKNKNGEPTEKTEFHNVIMYRRLAGEDMPLEPAGQKWTGAGCVLGHKRRIAWRILDAQYFGVPQRRRRVFLVASAGSADPAEILFERHGETGDFEAGAEAREEPAAFTEGSFGAYRQSAVGGTLKASGGTLSGGSETLIVNIAATLSTGFGGRGVDADQICNGNCVIDYPKVRKLTPVECERLQGFPDNHTLIPWRGNPAAECPDSPRYKAIGNSMAVPVMRWIGKRIMQERK